MASMTVTHLIRRGPRVVLSTASKQQNISCGRELSICSQRKRVQKRTSQHVSISRQFSHTPALQTIYKSHIDDLNLKQESLGHFMLDRMGKFGDKVAMVEFMSGRSYTFNQLKDYSVRVGSALTKMGLKKGDVVSLHCVNIPEFTILMIGAASIGVIVTTSNSEYTSGELARQLEHSRAKYAFTIPQFVPTVKEAVNSKQSIQECVKEIIVFGELEGYKPFGALMMDDGKSFPENVDIDPLEDIVVLPYSSGTTGLPKGVMLTHNNIVANLQQFRPIINVTEEDTAIGVLPFFHIYGMSPVMMGVLQDGGKLVTLPKFDPEQFLKALHMHKVTQLHAVPAIVSFLAKHPVVSKFDLSSLRFVISGAAPLGKEVSAEMMQRLNAPVRQGYGLTETSPVVSVDTDPPHPGTIGKLIPNTEAKIVCPETGKELGKGEVGELVVKGPQVMKGYYKNKEATDAIIQNDWMATGDMAFVNEDDCFVVADRLKELIKYKGFQVPPAELEDLLMSHPAIVDACVVGKPDDEAGEVPVAFVVKRPEHEVTDADVIQFVEDRASRHKRLRGGVQFVEQIPKSASGKILRRIMRDTLKKA